MLYWFYEFQIYLTRVFETRIKCKVRQLLHIIICIIFVQNGDS